MAEVKNSFIKSKMNKDLDARLVPSGEYRDALNVQVSRSEGEGVGSLENVLGNKDVATIEPGVDNLEAIGYYVDDINNDIYIFLTDNISTQYIPTGAGSNHFIYKYNSSTNSLTKLVEGAFLNFSKLNPIYGVNLLENLLFWTDNRNQPRKINVISALNDSSYYINEDQISVAKYNPYSAINLYEYSVEAENAGAAVDEYQTTMKDVVSKFLPGGGSAVVTALASSPLVTASCGITGLDFSNYPNHPSPGQKVGKIDSNGNIEILNALVLASTSAAVTFDTSIELSNGDELIFNPNYYYDPNYSGDSAFLEDKFIRFSYRFKFDDGEYSLLAPFTQVCFIPKQDGYFMSTGPDLEDNDQNQTVSSTIVSFMENKVNSIGLQIPLPCSQQELLDLFKIQNIEIIYKESDGLSLKVVESIRTSDLTDTDNVLEYVYDGKKPYKTIPEKELARVYDKVPVKALAQEVSGNRVIYGNYQNRHTPPEYLDYNVAATEKAVFDLRTGSAVVNGDVVGGRTIKLTGAKGTIEIGSRVAWSGSPDDVIVQEVNPSDILVDQDVSVLDLTPLTFDPSSNDKNTTSRIEYPNHSLKTNRGYQVGVVLSDRYGRTSDVILSNNKDVITINGVNYSGSSLYSPYIDENVNQIDWAGNSLKVLFNSVIGPSNPNASTFEPGLYNGDDTSEEYNPLGWYSYKIVVQQKEQEYYNVYAPGAIKGTLLSLGPNTEDTDVSYVVLTNDNINKVPRDLSEVGPQDKTFRSSVQLIGRVENNDYQWDYDQTGSSANPNIDNQQYYPKRYTFTTSSIQPLFDTFDWPATAVGTTGIIDIDEPIYAFYDAESNPLIGQLTTSHLEPKQFGVLNLTDPSDNIPPPPKKYEVSNSLCVFETKPVISLLDIYYETSTSGLVNELNYAILNDLGVSNNFKNFDYGDFNEDICINVNDGKIDPSPFNIIDQFGVELDPADYTSFELISAYDQQDPPQLVNNYFNLVQGTGNEYWIEVTEDFTDNIYYGENEGARRFDLQFRLVLDSGEEVYYNEEIVLGNEKPKIYRSPIYTGPTYEVTDGEVLQENITPFIAELKTVYGRNGSNDTTAPINLNNKADLTWEITNVFKGYNQNTDVTNSNLFELVVDNDTETNVSVCTIRNAVNPPESIRPDIYYIFVSLIDAGGASTSFELEVQYGNAPTQIRETQYTFTGGFGVSETRTFVEAKFEGLTQGGDGWYIYTNDWDQLQGSSFNTTILISNPITSTSSCPFDASGIAKWYYGGLDIGGSSLQTARNKITNCLGANIPGVSDVITNAGDYSWTVNS